MKGSLTYESKARIILMIFIAKDRASDYRIVIPKEASLSQKTAASQLQSYIYDISRAYVDISCDCKDPVEHEICIGFTNRDSGIDQSELDSLGTDGYIIRTVGEKVFLLGSEVRGALYAVYTFLEKFCNCRFYTNDFERVPKSDDITVPEITLKEVPTFEYRNVYWYAQSAEMISAKLKNNGAMGHDITARIGGGIEYNGDFCHTIGYLAELCKHGEAAWDQPCLSDEKVYETVLKNVKAELRAHPEKKIISVSQLDGNNGECSCEKCRKVYEEEHSHMGTMLRFVNRIQADIREEFPGVQVDTLAYRFSRKAPDVTKPDPDLIVRLCNIECCFRHPLEECDDSPAHTVEDHFVPNLQKWASITNHLYVWDYTTNFTNSSIPFVNFAAIRKNARSFAENGVTGMFEQGNIQSLNGEFGELRGYLLAKLLWNPYMSEEEYQGHMMDFLWDYYGEGAPLIKKYIDMEIDYSQNSHFGIYFDNAAHYVYYPYAGDKTKGAIQFMEKGFELFAEAEKAAANNPFALANIRRSRIQLHNYKWFVLNWQIEAAEKEKDKAAIAKFNQEQADNNKILFGLMRDYGVSCNREFSTVDFTKDPKDWNGTCIWW